MGESRPSPLNRAALYMLDEKDPAKFYAHEELFMVGTGVAAVVVWRLQPRVFQGPPKL